MNDLSHSGWSAPIGGISQRLPPSNVDAERALLGAVFANSRVLHRVVDFLKPEHFADGLHGRIYAESVKRVLNGGVADPLTLRTWFMADPEGAVVGVEYLSALLTSMIAIISAREYGQAIFDCWQRRQIIDIGEAAVNGGFDAASGKTPAELSMVLIERLDQSLAGADTERAAISLDEAVVSAVQTARDAQERGKPAGLSTGMPSVDRALGGLRPQTMTVIAARPGMGKSSLGRGWALEAAREALRARASGLPLKGVLLISLEMSAVEQAQCVLSAISGVPLEAIIHGSLEQPDWDLLVRAQNELLGLPISIEDVNGLDVGMIRLRARRARRRHGLGLIVIDHMHIVRTDAIDTKNGATWAVGKVSNGLKGMAKEFDCPVLALAQLNRGVEARDEKRPTLQDLRQAGEIEQDADAVGFIYRPEYYLPKGELEQLAKESDPDFQNRCDDLTRKRFRMKGVAELIFEKVRMGKPQSVNLHFDAATVSFSEASNNG